MKYLSFFQEESQSFAPFFARLKPGVATDDQEFQQSVNYPEFDLDIDLSEVDKSGELPQELKERFEFYLSNVKPYVTNYEELVSAYKDGRIGVSSIVNGVSNVVWAALVKPNPTPEPKTTVKPQDFNLDSCLSYLLENLTEILEVPTVLKSIKETQTTLEALQAQITQLECEYVKQTNILKELETKTERLTNKTETIKQLQELAKSLQPVLDLEEIKEEENVN